MRMVNCLNSPASRWVKSTMAELTTDEKLGQLHTSRAHLPDIGDSIARGIVGNLYTRTDIPDTRLAELQRIAKVPMIISADLESGNLYEKNEWPTQMTLGAIGDPEDTYKWAYYQGLEARAGNINSVYGPVLDVSLNPAGIATGTRTFGSSPEAVAQLTVAAIRGYQDAGILPFSKHFPGYGRGWEDAHFELSTLEADRETLFQEDLLPYIEAVRHAGLAGLMTGHIRVPYIDADLPLPLSPKIMSLLGDIGFAGISITDSLAMKSLNLHYPLSLLYPACLAAGHDIVIADYNTPDAQGHEYLKKGLVDGILNEDMIDRKVERVLKIKEYLTHFKPTAYDADRHRLFFEALAKKSVTCVKSAGAHYQPLSPAEKILFLFVSDYGGDVQGELQAVSGRAEQVKAALLERFAHADVEFLPSYPAPDILERALRLSFSYESLAVISLVDMKAYSGTLEITRPVKTLLSALRGKIHTMVVVGSPYSVIDLPDLKQLLASYGGGVWYRAVADVLCGMAAPEGSLPVHKKPRKR